MNLFSLRFCFARLLCFIIIGFTISDIQAQGTLCPPNLDFEMGDFTNWECSQGFVVSSGGENVVTLSPTGPGSVHTIIPASNQELDEYRVLSQKLSEWQWI